METQVALTIAFIGFNREQTIQNFISFADANNEDIIAMNKEKHYFVLKDGTTVKCVFRASVYKERFDQVIVSDDSRMMTKQCLQDFDIVMNNTVPDNFKIIEDNIDDIRV